MKFFNIDQHISVIEDMKNIFETLGHTIESKSISGHNFVFGREPANIEMVSGDAWCSTVNEWKSEEFYNTHREELDKYDGFICTYPPIFSILYEKTNKPIIINIPIRYECGADGNAELWTKFNEYLQTGVDEGRIFLVANNKYDKAYTEGFLGRDVRHIPSLCEYTHSQYNPVYDRFIYYATAHIGGAPELLVKKHDALKAGHSFQAVAAFKGIVHLPYNISTISTFEHYTANIPMFFPSHKFAVQLFTHYKQTCVLNQISWNLTNDKPSGSVIDFQYGNMSDPNDYTNIDGLAEWIALADYYDAKWMPHIQYFDTLDELGEMLDNADLFTISDLMKYANVTRRLEIYDRWETLLCEVEGATIGKEEKVLAEVGF